MNNTREIELVLQRLEEEEVIFNNMLAEHTELVQNTLECEPDTNCGVIKTLTDKIANCHKKIQYTKLKGFAYYVEIAKDLHATMLERYNKSDLLLHCNAYIEMNKVDGVRLYGSPSDQCVELMKHGAMSTAMWYFFFDPKHGIFRRNKDRSAWFTSYLMKPRFSVGDIVSIRSNVPQESILKLKTFKTWQGGSSSLQAAMRSWNKDEFHGMSYMIIGTGLPECDHKRWIKAYKPNNNGGMRFYKVLPMGGTEVYYIVERALKLNRTKAVKDAKK